eukprot:2375051-Rhodomonas_salina.1
MKRPAQCRSSPSVREPAPSRSRRDLRVSLWALKATSLRKRDICVRSYLRPSCLRCRVAKNGV